MKMFMIIVEDALRGRVESFLEQHDAKGYTELPVAYGEGEHGKSSVRASTPAPAPSSSPSCRRTAWNR
ncbi:MAG: hypothetical protein M5R36_24500 [Deltaproteobacteria bacterium]|nr:hypothetical protein [Deltaproteobacteria bacterium]